MITNKIKAAGAFVASKVNKEGNEIKEVLLCLGIFTAGLFAISMIQSPLIQLTIFVLIISLDNVILSNLNTFVNNRIKSSQRSTILSLLSLFGRSTEMLFLTSFGWIIDTHGFNASTLFTAGWLTLVLATLIIPALLNTRSNKKYNLDS